MSDTDLVAVVAARSAWPLYLACGAYVCQNDRTFRDADRLGFYSGRRIHPYLPRIVRRMTDITFSEDEAAHRLLDVDPLEQRLGRVIKVGREYGHGLDPLNQVVFLTRPGDLDTVEIRPLEHVGAVAWTMGQRYASLARLLAATSTADVA